MRYFVAGGAGFIGSHLVERLLRDPDTTGVVLFDALTYAADLDNLRGVSGDPRLTCHWASITESPQVEPAMRGCDVVINLAAETHVDRSIASPMPFVQSNVVGTVTLLEAARKTGVRRYVQVSTDEVYGSIPPPSLATEDWPIHTASPYSASKAAGDFLVQSYHETFGLDTIVTRGANTYGPRQFPEKLIPLSITRAMADQSLPLYGDGTQIRDWLYVEDHAAGIRHATHHGRAGEIYNIPGGNPRQNVQILMALCDHLEKPLSRITRVADRPGHDQRYAMDGAKLAALGWRPRWPLARGLAETVAWYRRRPYQLAERQAADPFLAAHYAGIPG